MSEPSVPMADQPLPISREYSQISPPFAPGPCRYNADDNRRQQQDPAHDQSPFK